MAKRKLKSKFKIIGFLITLLIVISFFFILKNIFVSNTDNNKGNTNTPPVEEKKNELSLIMVGDALIHSTVYDDAYENGNYNFDKMLKPVKKLIKGHDLAFYNQETILGGEELGLSSYPAFNSPYEVGDAFIDAGFNIVSLANNHTLDRGEKAIINSKNYWNKKDVLISGSATSMEERNNIQISEKNGIKYAMLAYTTTTNGIKPSKEYHVNIYNEAQVKEDIDSIRDKVDLLMVSMHWGEEYVHKPTTNQKSIAEYLSTLGVDIIIGHHPHVVQPIDYIGDTLVIYSLGNFLSGQENMARRIGLMVSIDITLEDKEIIISDPTARLSFTYYKQGTTKTNFKVYSYEDVNGDILNNYKGYYNKYIDIVTSASSRVKTLIKE